MKKAVLLTIHSEQRYEGQEPDVIELVTDGILERQDEDCWKITYEESDLTGLRGVVTALEVSPKRVVLSRTGELESQMVFEENVRHDSLYKLEYGALMIGVCARKIHVEMNDDGGTMEISYSIQIEQTQAGVVFYHIHIQPRE